MRKTVVFWVALFVVLTGCGNLVRQSDRIVVAECYGVKLYADELEGLVPAGAGKMDSLNKTNAFIDTWIRRQLLIHQAEINVSSQHLDFSKQLQDYRNSLIIYAYETQMIEQYLDTLVSQEEIAAYYEAHKDNFQIRSPMVKVAYVVLPEGCKQEKEFRQVLSDRDTLDMPRLDALVTQHAVNSYLEVDTWVRLEDLLLSVPLEIYNYESFFRKNRFVSFEKDNFVYMIRFEDYLLEQSVSPIEIESERIRNIILLMRQKELLEEMHADLYEQAKKEKVFEIY